MKTQRSHSYLTPFRTIFLVLLIACVSGAAKAGTKAEHLYLLAGTPIDNDPASYPATLYTVGPNASLETVRQIFSKRQGLFDVRDDLEGRLYAMSESQDILSVIHERNPHRIDIVKIDPNFYSPAWGVVAPPGQGSSAVLPGSGIGPHRWEIVTVAGSPTVNPRASAGTWALYRWFRYRGAPVVPWFEMVPIPGGNIVNGKILLGPVWAMAGVINVVPPALPPSVGAHVITIEDSKGTRHVTVGEVVIVADTARFFAFAATPFYSKKWPVPVYVQNKATKRWMVIDSPFIKLWPRVFGSWLATTINQPNPTGRKSPGVKNERSVPGYMSSTSRFPDIWGELGYWGGPHGIVRIYMPGKLLLQNLVDGRKITIETGQQDSEVLDVGKNGLVLYRVNNEIFSTRIEGDKLSVPKLVVKGEDVPEVHWVFWSNAMVKTQPAARPAAQHRRQPG